MAILKLHWQQIHQTIDNITSPGRRLATLGYPDFLVDREVLSTMYDNVDALPLDNLAGQTKKKHKAAPKSTVFDMLGIMKEQHGFEVTVFDVNQHRGFEVEADFNYPFDAQYHRQFDCVIDASCLEHCFNIGQAFANLCDLVAVGGVVSTVNPVYWYNHGYYNINPIMLYDGFCNNGFQILTQSIMDINGDQVTGVSRNTKANQLFNLVVAQRTTDQKFKWPIQTHKGKHLKL